MKNFVRLILHFERYKSLINCNFKLLGSKSCNLQHFYNKLKQLQVIIFVL